MPKCNQCPPVDVIQRELKISADKAQELFALMNGDKDPEEYSSVRVWRDKCHHWPPGRDCEAIMCAVNEVIEGYGVEAMRAEGYQVDSYHFNIIASYVNAGDTYAVTVVHDNERDIYRVTSYGDWLQEWETEHPVCANCSHVLDDDKKCGNGCAQDLS